MDSILELMDKLTLSVYEIGTKEWVYITHINNPSSFYVRPKKFQSYLTTVAAPGDSFLASDMQVRSSVVFMSKTLDKYVRGVVYYDNDLGDITTYDVFAIDYGYIEKSVELKDVCKLKYSHIPPLAIHCQLADCKPIGGSWTDREIDAMKCYISDEPALMLVREKTPETLSVQLYNSCPDDISTLMALTGFSHMGYGDNKVGRLTAPPPQKLFFKFKELKVDDILKVRLQCGRELNNFFVATKEDYKTYLDEQGNYTYFTKKLNAMQPDDLKENMSVGVLTDIYKYERGIIRQVLSEGRAIVQLIDWGKNNEYHISSMKPMSEKFYHNPAIAIYCSVEEKQLSDNRLLKYMYPGYEFTIKIKEVGVEFSKPNIVEILMVK